MVKNQETMCEPSLGRWPRVADASSVLEVRSPGHGLVHAPTQSRVTRPRSWAGKPRRPVEGRGRQGPGFCRREQDRPGPAPLRAAGRNRSPGCSGVSFGELSVGTNGGLASMPDVRGPARSWGGFGRGEARGEPPSSSKRRALAGGR